MGQSDSRLVASELQASVVPRLVRSAQRFPSAQRIILTDIAQQIERLAQQLESISQMDMTKPTAERTITLTDLNEPHIASIESQKASIEIHEAAEKLKGLQKRLAEVQQKLSQADAREKAALQQQYDSVAEEIKQVKRDIRQAIETAAEKHSAAAAANLRAIETHQIEAKNYNEQEKLLMEPLLAAHLADAEAHRLFAEFYRGKLESMT